MQLAGRHQSLVLYCCSRLRPNLVHTLRNYPVLPSCPSTRWGFLWLRTSCYELACCASLRDAVYTASTTLGWFSRKVLAGPQAVLYAEMSVTTGCFPLLVHSCAGVLWHLIRVTSAACTLRAAIVLSTWLHEAAHIVAATVLCSRSARTCLTLENITGDFSLWQHHSAVVHL